MKGIETIGVLFGVVGIVVLVALLNYAAEQTDCRSPFWQGFRIALGAACR